MAIVFVFFSVRSMKFSTNGILFRSDCVENLLQSRVVSVLIMKLRNHLNLSTSAWTMSAMNVKNASKYMAAFTGKPTRGGTYWNCIASVAALMLVITGCVLPKIDTFCTTHVPRENKVILIQIQNNTFRCCAPSWSAFFRPILAQFGFGVYRSFHWRYLGTDLFDFGVGSQWVRFPRNQIRRRHKSPFDLDAIFFILLYSERAPFQLGISKCWWRVRGDNSTTVEKNQRITTCTHESRLKPLVGFRGEKPRKETQRFEKENNTQTTFSVGNRL